MKLSKRILQSLDAERVRRINEIYHNLENACYDGQHEDIPQFEQRFWEEAAGRYVAADKPIVWLDYGTGTGFVPAAVAERLKAEDTVICCDVSNEMLRLCAAKLKGASFVISTDAHHPKHLANMRFGVLAARRGWLSARDIMNTRSLKEFEQFLRKN